MNIEGRPSVKCPIDIGLRYMTEESDRRALPTSINLPKNLATSIAEISGNLAFPNHGLETLLMEGLIINGVLTMGEKQVENLIILGGARGYERGFECGTSSEKIFSVLSKNHVESECAKLNLPMRTPSGRMTEHIHKLMIAREEGRIFVVDYTELGRALGYEKIVTEVSEAEYRRLTNPRQCVFEDIDPKQHISHLSIQDGSTFHIDDKPKTDNIEVYWLKNHPASYRLPADASMVDIQALEKSIEAGYPRSQRMKGIISPLMTVKEIYDPQLGLYNIDAGIDVDLESIHFPRQSNQAVLLLNYAVYGPIKRRNDILGFDDIYTATFITPIARLPELQVELRDVPPEKAVEYLTKTRPKYMLIDEENADRTGYVQDIAKSNGRSIWGLTMNFPTSETKPEEKKAILNRLKEFET